MTGTSSLPRSRPVRKQSSPRTSRTSRQAYSPPMASRPESRRLRARPTRPRRERRARLCSPDHEQPNPAPEDLRSHPRRPRTRRTGRVGRSTARLRIPGSGARLSSLRPRSRVPAANTLMGDLHGGVTGTGGVSLLAVRWSATARPVRGRDLRVCCREGRRVWSPGASRGLVDPAPECRLGRSRQGR